LLGVAACRLATVFNSAKQKARLERLEIAISTVRPTSAAQVGRWMAKAPPAGCDVAECELLLRDGNPLPVRVGGTQLF
jgi:polysaccharide deacetylase 2 family uncharacterized protein YibQ